MGNKLEFIYPWMHPGWVVERRSHLADYLAPNIIPQKFIQSLNSTNFSILYFTHFKMGKHSRKDGEDSTKKSKSKKHAKKSIIVDDAAVDPTLALLFASSVSTYLSQLTGLSNCILMISTGWSSQSASKIAL